MSGDSSDLKSATVLMVANYEPDVGFAWWLMDNFWVQLAKLSHMNGLHACIAYPTSGRVPDSIREARIETLIQKIPGEGVLGLWRTYRFVRSRRVRLVYFTDRPFSSLGYLVLRIAGVRVIINHDHTPGDRPAVGGPKGWLKRLWRRVAWVGCDLQICVSPLVRQRSIDNARIPGRRLAVVQNGIKPLKCGRDREYARRVLGLPPGTAICITVARADPYKRIDFVIEVARRCTSLRNRDDIVFVFCGDGPDMDRLRGLAGQASLGDRFVFAGRRKDVREILCSADLALHPSRGEAFSLAVLEYMSAGLAVLVPDIPTVCQAVRNGETGVVFPDGDAEFVTDRVCRLVDDPEERSRLGRNASRTANDDYSLEGMNDQFRAVLSAWFQQLQR
jgi:glycosyltransferase involved in cell wall biosynthesis